MFATNQANALPIHSAIAGGPFTIWSIVDIWGCSDTLLLQISEGPDRGSPRKVTMVDLGEGAKVIQQCVEKGHVVRGAALLKASMNSPSRGWKLEALREIRIVAARSAGAEVDGNTGTVATLTMADGSERHLPIETGIEAFPKRGMRIFVEQRPRVCK
ncbi:hypothetical protein ACGYWN_13330 [Burkholderia pseudomallei]|uniref:hypothetical protein n=1 Tax=Burkholderia pseudomallei TaxID=28450 RepID=UPI0007CF5B96|nr:hypothetical protein [Burkholderia pseudomallei]MBF3434171.1 hypothetical protein [Burkholderia pseudomallei]MBF3457077.1 hypothetical protein [Burkholderia pseudomallei]MBF3482948.1 hypothetical protein [Burkholderia pseudomallei]MBF3492477.1 hypothetical protein [Burkholderia pseudomallei]MBF3517755.1 hypothetical protein [Burkholderia pseudomallei]